MALRGDLGQDPPLPRGATRPDRPQRKPAGGNSPFRNPSPTGPPDQRRAQRPGMASRTRFAVSLGVRPTRTPTFSSASFFACAVPEDPDTIAPAWPIVFPSGAVNPAT